MKHLITEKCEPGEGFHCQLCDKCFFYSGKGDPICPNCGAYGIKWLEVIALREEEDEAVRVSDESLKDEAKTVQGVSS